jgi:hypothetical protein
MAILSVSVNARTNRFALIEPFLPLFQLSRLIMH